MNSVEQKIIGKNPHRLEKLRRPLTQRRQRELREIRKELQEEADGE